MLVKYLLGESSREESLRVLEWRDADPENLKYLTELEKVWAKSRLLEQASNIDTDAAWNRFQQRIQNSTGKPAAAAFPWFKVAAAAVILLTAGLLFFYIQTREPLVEQISRASETSPLIDSLSDGSIVTLNRGSVLSYPSRFEKKSREVKLEGEAFFDISHNEDQPFIVEADSLRVLVLGTRFNVREMPDSSEVIVESGKVRVSWYGQEVLLRPGEKAIANRKDHSLYKTSNRSQLYQYYRTNEFVCDQTPLWKLVEVLNEAYDAHIVIADPALRNLPLTSSFHNDSLEQVLTVIQLTFNLSVRRTATEIILE